MKTPLRATWIAARVLMITGLCALMLTAVRAQPVREPAPGVLLVAAENMGDPRFDHSVVLIVQHDRSGSWGLVINKPTQIGVDELLPELEGAGDAPDVYFGGPVKLDHVSFLYRDDATRDAPDAVLPGMRWSDSKQTLKKRLGQAPTDVRVYAGYAGWAPGQLEFEIAHGGWRLIQGRRDNVFNDEPGRLWDRLTSVLEGIAI